MTLRPGNRPVRAGWLSLTLAAVLLAGGCKDAPTSAQTAADAAPVAADTPALADVPEGRPRLGLMTSLPIYWPLGAGVAEIASGMAEAPWQRVLLEGSYVLQPLDSLAAIPGLSPQDPETDPLAGLDRIAIIQPRGLSPADNVALDDWVRGGGRLLLALDPMLTGEYDLALGDPRRPVDAAQIPPVVARWGMMVRYDDAQPGDVQTRTLGDAALPTELAGEIVVTDAKAAQCTLLADGAAARCRVGKGSVTLIADAAVFEHETLSQGEPRTLTRVIEAALP